MCLLKMRPRTSQKLCSVRTPTVLFLIVIEIHPMKVYILRLVVIKDHECVRHRHFHMRALNNLTS